MEGSKNNRKFWIIIILLIIILITLFLTRFGKIENNITPTGNVSVFDIDINCKCTDKNNCTTNDDNGNTVVVPIFNEDDDGKVLGKVFVDDVNGNYIYQQRLEIFTNAAFEYTNKIAPGVSNTYQFVVHNSTNKKLNYYVQMYEESEYDINLKYRLRRNNDYVVGDDNTWVTANELKTAFSKIDSSSSDSYSLDWIWEFNDDKDAEDTLAGSNMESNYKLDIRFYFESIEA